MLKIWKIFEKEYESSKICKSTHNIHGFNKLEEMEQDRDDLLL